MRPVGPCATCDYWRDGCALIREGRVGALLDSGACEPWTWVRGWISRFLRYQHAEALGQEEDVLQELQVFLRQPGFRVPRDVGTDADHLRPYLRSAVLNRATDFLRRERLAPKVRCGACLYRGAEGCCSLAAVTTAAGRREPHPHHGRPVEAGANPQALRPPCGEFFWRYRPRRLEEISVRRKVSPPGPDPAGDQLGGVVTLALEELMQAGKAGRRRALMLREHFLGNRTAKAIAEHLGVNERTVRRNLRAGLASLRTILEDRLGFREEELQ